MPYQAHLRNLKRTYDLERRLDIGEYDKAIQDFSKAIELDPTNVSVYYSRGDCYKNIEEYDKAIQDFSKAIELDPTNASVYYSKAIQDFSKAIELDPTNASVYYSRGHCYEGIEEDDKAIQDFSKALEINPNYEF